MLIKSLVFICGLLTVTAIHRKIRKSKNENIKSGNLDLVLQDGSRKTLTDDVERLLTKMKSVNKNVVEQLALDDKKSKLFTNFIQALVKTLHDLDDSDLEYFVRVAREEVRKYHYGGSFHDFTNHYGLRRFIGQKLDTMKRIPAEVIRRKLTHFVDVLQQEKYGNNTKELIDYVNSLYRRNTQDKFEKVLTSISNYILDKSKAIDFREIIQNGIRSIVLDHYTELNYQTRATLKSKIDQYWEILANFTIAKIEQSRDKKRTSPNVDFQSHHQESQARVRSNRTHSARPHTTTVRTTHSSTTVRTTHSSSTTTKKEIVRHNEDISFDLLSVYGRTRNQSKSGAKRKKKNAPKIPDLVILKQKAKSKMRKLKKRYEQTTNHLRTHPLSIKDEPEILQMAKTHKPGMLFIEFETMRPRVFSKGVDLKFTINFRGPLMR